MSYALNYNRDDKDQEKPMSSCELRLIEASERAIYLSTTNIGRTE